MPRTRHPYWARDLHPTVSGPMPWLALAPLSFHVHLGLPERTLPSPFRAIALPGVSACFVCVAAGVDLPLAWLICASPWHAAPM